MPSQRIADSLEVLDLTRLYFAETPTKSISSLRQRAVKHVASRGVFSNTVYAHLVGKATRSTLSGVELDTMIKEWLIKKSDKLKMWMVSTTGRGDHERIRHFFEVNPATPTAIDIEEASEPARVLTTTYRVLRDTALARRIKADKDYRCQLCHTQIKISTCLPYAEAHHVKPLGSPHNGPDIPENILCLCPNCHVMLDYGAIELRKDQLPEIRTEFIAYHNEIVCNQRKV
jgi:hypothetical protein